MYEYEYECVGMGGCECVAQGSETSNGQIIECAAYKGSSRWVVKAPEGEGSTKHDEDCAACVNDAAETVNGLGKLFSHLKMEICI